MNDPPDPLLSTGATGRDRSPLDFGGDCNAMLAGLYHFLDGELTDDRRTHIQSHLDACPSCYGVFDFEAELRIVVRSRVQLRVPDALVQKIRLAIRDEPLG